MSGFSRHVGENETLAKNIETENAQHKKRYYVLINIILLQCFLSLNYSFK